MSTRDEVLDKIRQTLNNPALRFPAYNSPPLTNAERMTVTTASGEFLQLAERFGAELEALHGTFEIVESPAVARMACIRTVQQWMQQEQEGRKGMVLETGQEQSLLGWNADCLPVPGLADAFADMGIQLVAPEDLTTPESREEVRMIRYGITGVEAAIASTGSMLMLSSSSGVSRSASLLPYSHVVLIPFDRLYATVESWLAEKRQTGKLIDLMCDNANISMITGPSKSADIEGNLTLGVHGPRHVHAILFDEG